VINQLRFFDPYCNWKSANRFREWTLSLKTGKNPRVGSGKAQTNTNGLNPVQGMQNG
jgi:hypothetical protein